MRARAGIITGPVWGERFRVFLRGKSGLRPAPECHRVGWERGFAGSGTALAWRVAWNLLGLNR